HRTLRGALGAAAPCARRAAGNRYLSGTLEPRARRGSTAHLRHAASRERRPAEVTRQHRTLRGALGAAAPCARRVAGISYLSGTLEPRARRGSTAHLRHAASLERRPAEVTRHHRPLRGALGKAPPRARRATGDCCLSGTLEPRARRGSTAHLRHAASRERRPAEGTRDHRPLTRALGKTPPCARRAAGVCGLSGVA